MSDFDKLDLAIATLMEPVGSLPDAEQAEYSPQGFWQTHPDQHGAWSWSPTPHREPEVAMKILAWLYQHAQFEPLVQPTSWTVDKLADYFAYLFARANGLEKA